LNLKYAFFIKTRFKLKIMRNKKTTIIIFRYYIARLKWKKEKKCPNPIN